MRAYGISKKDTGCCPGHDKYSKGYKNSRTKRVRRQTRPAKKKARQQGKKEGNNGQCN